MSVDNRDEHGPVRVGVVGLGQFGLVHAQTLAGLGEAELVAGVDVGDRSREALAAAVPGVPTWSDLDAAVRESGAQAWVVASSTASHVPIAQKLLSAGLPVLIEKPIAPTLAEAQQLEPLVAADSSNLMLGHILLFNSEIQQLKRELADRPPIVFINAVRHRPIAQRHHFRGEDPFRLLMVHD
ncbi:MAG TPA: Gfo/Idh/MocA family oxidoreductase, partial [Phycisphaeraceae bacterium]